MLQNMAPEQMNNKNCRPQKCANTIRIKACLPMTTKQMNNKTADHKMC